MSQGNLFDTFKKKRNRYLSRAINHQTVNEWVSLNHTRKLVMSFVFNLFCFVLFLWFCFYNCFATMLLELVTNFQPVNIFISKIVIFTSKWRAVQHIFLPVCHELYNLWILHIFNLDFFFIPLFVGIRYSRGEISRNVALERKWVYKKIKKCK